jgi:hydroxymethylglutaryl-CoA lyase
VPTEVTILMDAVRNAVDVPIGAHLHDTRGLAIANAIAAIESGAERLDASVGGLGGCPFAPNAGGNVPIEDLAHALEAMGVSTGLDIDRLVEAARLACTAVSRPVSSHIGLAGRRFAV